MVKPFRFAKLPLILFGPGQFSGLTGLIKRYGRTALLVTGRNSFMSSSYGESLVKTFNENGIDFKHITIPGEPSPEMIDNVTLNLGENKPDVVIAVGGGSVSDAGKAISAMCGLSQSVIEFLEGVGTMEHPGTKIPFIAIPTTSGTGSEATKNAVISQIGKNGFKRSLRHDNFVPDIALVDPELTLQCPQTITAASGMDCFTQLTEAYLSDKSNEYSDAFALEGLKAIRTSLVRSYADGRDIEARTGMSFAALTSGICLTNAGLGVIHGFASSIGGMYKIPHGLICGTLMASANKISVRELRKKSTNQAALKKYVHLGDLFLGETGKSDDYCIDGFIEYLFKMTDDLHLPRLKESGFEEKDVELICRNTENKNNPVKLVYDDLTEILLKRL